MKTLQTQLYRSKKLLKVLWLVLLGAYLLFNNIIDSLSRYMPSAVYEFIRDVTRTAPQIIIGVAIIAVGTKLILGKKKECEIDD